MEASFSHESGAPKSNLESFKLPVDDVRVQAILALMWYGKQNNLTVDFLHPEQVSRETKNLAMEAWVGDMSNRSLSADYRAYVGAHGEDIIDTSDGELLAKLLEDVLKGEEETTH